MARAGARRRGRGAARAEAQTASTWTRPSGLGGHAARASRGGCRPGDWHRSRRAGDRAGAARDWRTWADRVELVHDAHERIGDVLAARGVPRVDGVLADLGVSSMQLDRRGSRIQLSTGRTARHADGPVARRRRSPRSWPRSTKRALADVIWQYGEERRSRRVARLIVEARDRGGLTDTAALAVSRAARRRGGHAGSGSIRRRGRFRRFGSG